jgi:glycosyltransferase involved in cell wall biosynthesis
MQAKSVALNGAYIGFDDGTATWSACLADSLSGISVVQPGFDPTRHSRVPFLRKIGFEMTFQFRHRADIRVHPYSACALDRSSALVVLDTVGAATGRGWHSTLVRQSIRRSSYLATISSAEKEALDRMFSRDFTVLTMFPDRVFFETPRKVKRTVGAQLLVGYWGGWHPRKGMSDLLSAFKPTDDIRFICTGNPPPEIAARPDIELVGRLGRADLLALVDYVDVALYPSHAEGFGLPPYEALLRGRPVVLRNLPCYNEYLAKDLGPGVTIISDDSGLRFALDRTRAVSGVEPGDYLQTPEFESARARLKTQVECWLDLL